MKKCFCLWHMLATVFLLLGAMPSSAFAYCIGWDQTQPNYDPQYYSVSHEFRRSQWVVKAKVLKGTWIGEDGKEKPLQPSYQYGDGAFYYLQIEQAFKGSPPSTVRVFSENSTARFSLKNGEEILTFISPEEFDDPIGKQFTLDTCGNFRPFPEAKGLLGAVQEAAKAQK